MSREMVDQKRTRATGIITLIVVITLGLVNVSSAMEIHFGTETMIIASDNIDRAPAGEEAAGYLLSLEGDLRISGNPGSASVDLSVGGGWETLDNGDGANKSDNYRAQFNTRIPWSGTGYIEATADASDETVEPELNDISQNRVKTKRSGVRLAVGRQVSSTFEWETAVSQRTENRFDRDFEELQAELDWEFQLDRRRSFVVEWGASDGTDDFDGDTWHGSSVLVDMRKRFNPASTKGYLLAWEGLKVNRIDGTSEWTDKVTTLLHYESRTPSGVVFISDLGVDGIKPPSDDRRWELHAELGLSQPPERRFRASANLSTIADVQDPVESRIAWTRESQLRAGIAWSVSRTYTIGPNVQFFRAELFGTDIDDRTDNTLILRLDTRWIPARNWSFDLTALVENRTSSQSDFDLSENRLVLTVVGDLF